MTRARRSRSAYVHSVFTVAVVEEYVGSLVRVVSRLGD